METTSLKEVRDQIIKATVSQIEQHILDNKDSIEERRYDEDFLEVGIYEYITTQDLQELNNDDDNEIMSDLIDDIFLELYDRDEIDIDLIEDAKGFKYRLNLY